MPFARLVIVPVVIVGFDVVREVSRLPNTASADVASAGKVLFQSVPYGFVRSLSSYAEASCRSPA